MATTSSGTVFQENLSVSNEKFFIANSAFVSGTTKSVRFLVNGSQTAGNIDLTLPSASGTLSTGGSTTNQIVGANGGSLSIDTNDNLTSGTLNDITLNTVGVIDIASSDNNIIINPTNNVGSSCKGLILDRTTRIFNFENNTALDATTASNTTFNIGSVSSAFEYFVDAKVICVPNTGTQFCYYIKGFLTSPAAGNSTELIGEETKIFGTATTDNSVAISASTSTGEFSITFNTGSSSPAVSYKGSITITTTNSNLYRSS